MNKTFKEALQHRRSCYAISNCSPVSDNQIEEIIRFAVLNTPSAFNSQSTRLVLLLGENHAGLWNIVKNELKKIVPESNFPATENKIDKSFASGYGTVLFFEDQSVVKELQDAFPLYADQFPVWSQHTSAMHQLVVWTMLDDAGFGASLQHYNPLIDDAVHKTWNLDKNWTLTAQMPFGVKVQEPGKKEFKPLSERIKIFK
ncbi:MAG: nitroreductase family protein [Candidatus Azobacteroides sp.]|nr:nitroreductase family protein [Candidatus Azobacteroides sp.]